MKPRRRISTQYCVHTGRPSWHQQRAGHISSGATCFWTKKEAKRYQRNFKKHHPDEPAFIQTERKIRRFGPPTYHERSGRPPGVPLGRARRRRRK